MSAGGDRRLEPNQLGKDCGTKLARPFPNTLRQTFSRGFVRVIEEELVAVEIVDDQQSIAPRAVFHGNALASSSARNASNPAT